jgi:hypothetical protein
VPATVNRSVTIVNIANDPESTLLALQLANIFRIAGWQPMQTQRTYNALVLGLQIPDPANETTLAIRAAFTAINFQFGTAEPGGGGFIGFGGGLPGQIPATTIITGSRPPPF